MHVHLHPVERAQSSMTTTAQQHLPHGQAHTLHAGWARFQLYCTRGVNAWLVLARAPLHGRGRFTHAGVAAAATAAAAAPPVLLA